MGLVVIEVSGPYCTGSDWGFLIIPVDAFSYCQTVFIDMSQARVILTKLSVLGMLQQGNRGVLRVTGEAWETDLGAFGREFGPEP